MRATMQEVQQTGKNIKKAVDVGVTTAPPRTAPSGEGRYYGRVHVVSRGWRLEYV